VDENEAIVDYSDVVYSLQKYSTHRVDNRKTTFL